MESAAKSVKGVLGVHGLRAEYVGPNMVSAGFHIEVAPGTRMEKADTTAEKVDETVGRKTDCKYCTIRIDPAGKK